MATPIADMVEKMLSTGIPPEMIVLAVRTVELSQPLADQTAEKRRRWDRERKRQKNSTGIPPVSVPLIKEERKEIKKESKRGTRLPEGWKPDPNDCAYAIDHGLNPETVTIDFCDYWHARAGPGAIKVDWKATWRRWCRTTSERQGGKPKQKTAVLDFAAGFDARTRMQLAEREEIERQRQRP